MVSKLQDQRSNSRMCLSVCHFKGIYSTLVTHRMLLCRPNPTELSKGDFLLLRSDGGGTFCLHFWNLHKIWI